MLTLDTPAGWLALITYVDRDTRVSAEAERLYADALRFGYAFALDRCRLLASQDAARAALASTEERRAYWSGAAEAFERVAIAIETTGAFEWGRLGARRHYRLSLAPPTDRTGEDAEGWAYMGRCISSAMHESDRLAPMLARMRQRHAEILAARV